LFSFYSQHTVTHDDGTRINPQNNFGLFLQEQPIFEQEKSTC
jgi:hypothetical protein